MWRADEEVALAIREAPEKRLPIQWLYPVICALEAALDSYAVAESLPVLVRRIQAEKSPWSQCITRHRAPPPSPPLTSALAAPSSSFCRWGGC